MFPILLAKEDLLLGSLLIFLLVFFMVAINFLRNDKRIFKVILFLIMIFLTELLLIKFQFIELNNFDSIYLIITPMVYIITYFILRKIFIYLYGMEPTYNRSSWFDYSEGRRQNGGDMMVFFIPLILAVTVCLFI